MIISHGIFRRISLRTGALIGLALVMPMLGGQVRAAGAAGDIRVKTFAQLPLTTNLRLSPDGKYFALITPYKGVRHLLIRRLDQSAEPIVVPPFEKLEMNWFAWASNERLVVSFKFESKRRLTPTVETRLVAVNRDGTNLVAIVRPNEINTPGSRFKKRGRQPQVQDNIIDYLWKDPDHILLSVDADMDGEDEVRIIDINSGDFKQIGNDFRGIQDWYTDPGGEIRYANGFDGKKPYSMYRSPDSGKWTNFSKTAAFQNGLAPISFAKDPHQAYMSRRSEAGTLGIVKYDIGHDKEIESVFDDKTFSYGGIMVDRYSGETSGLSFIGDRPHLIYFNDRDKKRQRTLDKVLKGTFNHVISSSLDGSLHIVLATSDVDPGIYYLYDQKNKRLSQFAINYDGIDPDLMSPMKAVSYEARDKLKIPAYLTVPRGREAKNLPVVVLPHGGPQSRDYIRFDYWVQFLASRGYVVFQPNFRGSSGYSADFRNAGYQNWGLAMQDDVTDGVKWLIAQGIADPKRICIVGGSYGGYAAMMGAVKTPDLYRCAASINGVSDLKGMIYSDKKYIGGSYWSQSIGKIGEDSQQLRDTSPYLQAAKIKIPMLLIHARDDRTVPFKQTKNMAKSLKKAGVVHRFVQLEDGGHTLDTEKARLMALQALEKFLAKYL